MRPKVHLVGGDNMGWALDEDLARTREALEGVVEFASLENCDAVHLTPWYHALELPRAALEGRRVISHLPGEPRRLLSEPRFDVMHGIVGRWIVHSRQAQKQWEGMIGSCAYVPYGVEADVFRPIEPISPDIEAIREKYKLPRDRYLIGSFQRDSQGFDLGVPKLVKGPDVLLEIGILLKNAGAPVHFLLAGPRRHWLRGQLEAFGVPYTFVGDPVEADDININTRTREELARLYALCDLYVVSSRTEGGPFSVLEAAACRCKIISRRVGHAEDVLEPESLFDMPDEAAAMIEQDIRENILAATVDPQHQRISDNHSIERRRAWLAAVYQDLESIPPSAPITGNWKGDNLGPSTGARARRLWQKLFRKRSRLVIWHKFKRPPWGGGNQFLLALRRGLRARGMPVSQNRVRRSAAAHLFNAVTFDVDLFERRIAGAKARIIHRVDGPYSVIRGEDQGLDDKMCELNRRFADVTVIQSRWCATELKTHGHIFKNITLIPNAADPEIFSPPAQPRSVAGRQVRLIASSWSDNVRKGGPIYKWLEENLDWERYAFTFVGRCSEPLARARRIDAVDSRTLAGILREHDIFITASRNDPCSNALIEAQSCGLPALYVNDGGHPELVGLGGLPFSDGPELLRQLDRLTAQYDMFARLVNPPAYQDVVERYRRLVEAD